MLSDADIMAHVFAAFQAEQAEHRQAAGELLLDLEREPEHPDRRTRLDQLFREAHSLKGGARAAGMTGIEQIAHSIEEIFAAMRQGAIGPTPEVCDPVYAALDAIGVLMEQAAPGHDPAASAYSELLATLSRAAHPAVPTASSADTVVTPSAPIVAPPASIVAPPAPVVAPPAPVVAQPMGEVPPRSVPPSEPPPEATGARGGQAFVGEETVRLTVSVLDGLMNEAGELMTCSLRARQLAREAQSLHDLPARWRRMWRRLSPALMRLRENAPAVMPVVHHLNGYDAGDGHPTLAGQPGTHPQQRVGLEHEVLLDALEQANTLIAELTTNVGRLARQATEDQTRLAAVTDRLHAQIRRTRMLPLDTLVKPLRLQLREMARAAGKQAMLEVDDHGAEADRQVLEQLREVFMHLLRNAIDHGIEAPADRIAAGKAAVGTVTLRASVSGDRLTIALADDGCGLDIEAVGRRAIASGLMGLADVERAASTELSDLIFLAGFSTRQTVSALSGRGVGLDVVRSRVERMHGRVLVASQPGQGTIFTIDVPLSLTSSHGLLLRAAEHTYVLPLDAVQRIVMLAPGQIQTLEGRPVLRYDGRPLPLATLKDLLGLASERPAADIHGLALILGNGDRQVACLVDAILGEQELVVHRLPTPLTRVRFLSGATILADGSVVPILDVVDLVRAAAGAQRTIGITAAHEEHGRGPVILVADDSITTRTLEKNILEAAGYTVCLATDGQEAFEALRRLVDDGGCDLLLSDIDMPRLNGFDLTTQVRADTKLRHLPVVLVTSLDSPADRERGVAAGADAYIVKRAFDQQTLLDTIAQLI